MVPTYQNFITYILNVLLKNIKICIKNKISIKFIVSLIDKKKS